MKIDNRIERSQTTLLKLTGLLKSLAWCRFLWNLYWDTFCGDRTWSCSCSFRKWYLRVAHAKLSQTPVLTPPIVSKRLLRPIHPISYDQTPDTCCIVSQAAAFIARSHQLGATPTIGQFGPASAIGPRTYNRLDNHKCIRFVPFVGIEHLLKKRILGHHLGCSVYYSAI